jgi:hypothetical protein
MVAKLPEKLPNKEKGSLRECVPQIMCPELDLI